MTIIKSLFATAVLGALLAGCNRQPQVGVVAPAKPLSPQQQKLLTEINAIPQTERKNFVMQHEKEILAFSGQNKTFGDGMNAALAVTPPKNP